MRFLFLVFLIVIVFVCPAIGDDLLLDSPADTKRPIFGWIEKIRIYPEDVVLSGKLDTGADHCSLHATNIKRFRRKGKKWVRFEIVNRLGQRRQLERKIVRVAKIKRIQDKPQKRYVIRLPLCLGDRYMEVDTNLVDRSSFSYPVLVGRGFLAGNAVVDSSKTYTSEPECDLRLAR